MKKLSSLHELLVDQLKDLYNAEKQITKALPKMIKKANSEELKQAFTDHLEETEDQIARLEEVFQELGMDAKGKKCEAMEGLINEAKELLEEDAAPNVMDAGLIVCAQKVEHYEIATYGSLRTFADLLGYSRVADLLETTLNEEKATDEKLTQIAESTINIEAAEAEEEEEEEEKPRTKKR